MLQIHLSVLEGGLQTTLQDLGRTTGRRYGIPPGGALDRAAHLAANRLVLNQPQAATLEITLQGPRLLFETSALIAITGADFGPMLDGRPIPMWLSVFVRAGQTLEWSGDSIPRMVEPKRNWGRVCYLSLHGGFAGPQLLGSRATYLKAKLSGYNGLGRVLQTGDTLNNTDEVLRPFRHLAEGAGRTFPEVERPAYREVVKLGLIPGPYEENFSEEAYHLLFSESFTLLQASDRMGFRLKGPLLPHRSPELAEIASCATVFGAVQVPLDGQPIVLMADHQVTGGYPITGTIISSDLPLLAQLLPGGKVSFHPLSPVNWS
ncbi:MAG: biotin-dependent carboxyltransferase [Chloroflexi bacterium]|nr:biotin-dependent carboxyltransferase [Chloroflexota bacterium]